MANNFNLFVENALDHYGVKKVLFEQDAELFRAGQDPNDFEGSCPKVDWDQADNYGYKWTKKTVKKYTDSKHDYIYPSMLDACDLSPKLVEFEESKEIRAKNEQSIRADYPDEFIHEDPDDPEAEIVSWQDVRDRLARECENSWEDTKHDMARPYGTGYPPAVVIRTDKDSYDVVDGNHRIALWQEQGYNVIPAWVIDNWIAQQNGVVLENALDHYGVKNPMIDAAFKVLQKIKSELGEEALIVGGSVRDIIMGKDPHDVDIATSASPDQIGTIFKTHDIGKSKDFGIVVVRQDGFDFEVAQYRADGEYTDSRRPDSVTAVKDFKNDASRRDFSINALGINSEGEIVDHFGGIDDIKNQMIKAVGDPRKRFTEDALRILRMIRFAAKTGFSIEPHTFEAAKELAPLITKLSSERIRDEMYKAAGSGTSLAKFVEGLDSIGLLETILPEVYQMKDLKHDPRHHPEGGSLVLGHVLEALKASKSSNPLTNIAILFHDLGKTTTLGYKNDQPTYYGHEAAGIPVFQKLATRLKISNADKEAIEFAIGNHMHGHKLGELNDNLVLRLRQNPNWELLKDVIYSDEASREHVFNPEEHENKMKRADDVMQKFGDKEAFEKRMSALINGEVIMSIIPNVNGKEIGRIKNLVRDWIIQQQFNVTPEQVKEKILEISTMKENKFNKLTKELLEHLVKEDNSAGGAMGVFGNVAAASPHIAGTSYAISYAGNDTRLPKPLGKGVMRRNAPELTVFATGVSRKKGKSKNKGKKQHIKR